MSFSPFDNPEELSAVATYAGLLLASPELAPVVLHGHETIPAMVAALGGVTDPLALEALAADPNAPAEALAFLAGPFPAAVCANPVFPLLLLENPSLPAEMPAVSLGRLLAYAGVPADFVAAVAAYGRPDMAAAARLHVALAGEAGEGWRADLVAAVALLPNTPDDDLLVALATLGLVPAWLRSRLESDARVALALAGATVAPEEPAAAPPLAGRAIAAADPATPRDELWRLADDEDAAVRAALARNPALSPEELAELKRREDQLDNDPAVYKAIAAELRAPPELLVELARNQSALFTVVRRAVARNPSAPPAALELLADELYAADIRLHLAAHANLGPAQRQKMVEASLDAALGAGDPLYRAIALSHPAAHPRALALADRSPHWLERLALALNPAAPPAALARLAGDGNRLVRAAAAERV